MASLVFRKVEGLGNDFLIIDLQELAPPALAQALAMLSRHAPRLCDRRRGVGADGLLVLAAPSPAAPPQTRAAMIVINFDGSRPEMCGNGLRCVAADLGLREGQPLGQSFLVETDAGPLKCVMEAAPSKTSEAAQIRVDMGRAELRGETLPAAAPGRSFINVSTGNPHTIHFVDASEDPEQLARSLGPALEVDPAYLPAKTNVEFARVEGSRIILWVWERGVGITEACGTGACATAFAAVARGLVPAGTLVDVQLPGGVLQVHVREDGGLDMIGPARQVFTGSWPGLEL